MARNALKRCMLFLKKIYSSRKIISWVFDVRGMYLIDLTNLYCFISKCINACSWDNLCDTNICDIYWLVIWICLLYSYFYIHYIRIYLTWSDFNNFWIIWKYHLHKIYVKTWYTISRWNKSRSLIEIFIWSNNPSYIMISHRFRSRLLYHFINFYYL